MDEESGWCTIESDPAVFTALLQRMGVRGVQVDEVVMGLDDEALAAMEHPALAAHQQVLGLILLHKWSADMPRTEGEPTDAVFFARQTVNNACATQALLSVLLNAAARGEPGVVLGTELAGFASFCSDLDPASRGEAIGACDLLRVSHNAFARPEVLVYGEAAQRRKSRSTETEDPFHFVAFVPDPRDGNAALELDGLQPSPVPHRTEQSSKWPLTGMAAVRAKVAQLMAADSDIRFGLLAVVRDRIELAEGLLASGDLDDSSAAQLHEVLEDESARRETEAVENARRQHNLVPLALALLGAKANLAASLT